MILEDDRSSKTDSRMIKCILFNVSTSNPRVFASKVFRHTVSEFSFRQDRNRRPSRKKLLTSDPEAAYTLVGDNLSDSYHYHALFSMGLHTFYQAISKL